MLKFKCKTKKEKWEGEVTELVDYGGHYEMQIKSRSSIKVLFGKTSQGGFACMPDFKAGSHLVELSNKFWNTEKLSEVLRKTDAITVAEALYSLAKSKIVPTYITKPVN